MRRILAIAFLALLLAMPAMAVDLGWENDPNYINGSTVLGNHYTLTTIIEAKLKTDPDTAWKSIAEVTDYGVKYSYPLPNTAFSRGATIQFRAKAKIPGLNSNGELVTLESPGYSNIVDYTLPSLSPENPRNLSITVTLGNLQSATIVFTKKAGTTWSTN